MIPPSARRRPARADAGFTLIEILIALGLLVIGMAGVLMVFNKAAQSHKRAMDHVRAATAADNLIAEQRAALTWENYGPGEAPEDVPHPEDPDELRQLPGLPVPGLPGHTYTLEWELLGDDYQAADGTAESWLVTLVFWWMIGDRAHGETFRAVLRKAR